MKLNWYRISRLREGRKKERGAVNCLRIIVAIPHLQLYLLPLVLKSLTVYKNINRFLRNFICENRCASSRLERKTTTT